MISVIIPANNEAGYIGACLDRLCASEWPSDQPPLQVVVVANGCSDTTVEDARACQPAFAAKGWTLDVLNLSEGNKIAALNAGDAAAVYHIRVYIDADIRVSPPLLAQLAQVLNQEAAAYASGEIEVPPAQSFISNRYARFWQKLPFIQKTVPGCGVYAVNAAGRARWGAFPQIISDDTFARYHFAEEEMHKVPAPFSWPITEGFASLVRVRRRQDAGLAEIRAHWPELAARMAPTAPDGGEKLRLFLRDPLGFVIYSVVALTVRTPLLRSGNPWHRGR